jgi:hypothetical protein
MLFSWIRLEWGDFHRAPHPSIYSVEWCGGTCRLQEAGASSDGMGVSAGPWMHHLCILGRWLVLQCGCEDSTWRNLDRKSVVKLVESSKCVTMGPWIHHEQILSHDHTDLDRGFPLAEGEIPWISDVVGPKVGSGDTLVGPGGACLWALGLLSHPVGPNVYVCHHWKHPGP